MASNSTGETAAPRRVLATRNAGWAKQPARQLASRGVSPNAISIASVVVAFAAAAAFAMSSSLANRESAIALVVAAACIQLRLLCNLLDGMLAVEHGLKHKTGEIFNELPDRIADIAILAGAGYAIPYVLFGTTLGWAAATLAVLTAYIRVLGGSLGLTQHFIGPMAKQHRMFTLTLAALVAAAEAMLGRPPRALPIALAIIIAGAAVTAVRRTRRLLREANAR